MKKNIKTIGITLIAGAAIYAGMQFTANTMVDEVLVSKHIKTVEEMLGGSLTYKKAGVDSKFTPIINDIEITGLLPIPGARVTIASLTVNEMKELNFNIDLKNVGFLVDSNYMGGDKDLAKLLAKGGDIALINKCENDRCDLTVDVKIDGIASFKVGFGAGNVGSIRAAFEKVDLKAIQVAATQQELRKEFIEARIFFQSTIKELFNLYTSVGKEKNLFEDPEIAAAMKERSKEERRNVLFTALNEKYERDAPSQEVKDALILINEIVNADLSINAKISKIKSSSDTLKSKMNADQLKLADSLSARFSDVGVSLARVSDDIIFNFSFNGMESTYKLTATATAPSIVEMAQIKNHDSYDRVISKIKAVIKSSSDFKGLGLTTSEVTQIVDLVSVFGLPVADRQGVESWLLDNVDKLTTLNEIVNVSFEAKDAKLIIDSRGRGPLLEYDIYNRSLAREGNPSEIITDNVYVKIKFKEFVDVIYSGIKAVAGEGAYREIIAERDSLLKKENILGKLNELRDGENIDLSKFFTSMGIHSNDELAIAVGIFVKNPGVFKINFEYPDGESNPLIPIMYPDSVDMPSDGKNTLQLLDKYLSIEIQPKKQK